MVGMLAVAIMYLSDHTLLARLDQLAIKTPAGAPPFDAGKQVQACSIDLRVDSIFWRQRFSLRRAFFWRSARLRPLNLGRPGLIDRSPRYGWHRHSLLSNEAVDLGPGEFILARTCEEFTIPDDCAGKIEGRSSFARLGLSIHCSADFINPGYRGHMPLELVNHSKRAIRLEPFLSVCQLLLVQLDSPPSQAYPQREPQSKYMDDDGGPSVWWRDAVIAGLRDVLASKSVAETCEEALLSSIGVHEPELVERFEGFIQKVPAADLANHRDILARFSKTEDRRRSIKQLTKHVLAWSSSSLGALALGGILFVGNNPWIYWQIALLLVTAAVGYYCFRFEIGEYFGEAEFKAYEVAVEGPRELASS